MMIKKGIISILTFLLFSSVVFADGNESLFALANQKYSEGQFEEAKKSYEEILANGYESAALYYNYGNACYKQNELTLAILNYERALLLSPGDKDIKYNLDIANQLFVSESTIKTHLYRAFRKIGVSSRGQAIAWAQTHIHEVRV